MNNALLKKHYQALFKEHGHSCHALQWSSTATQQARFSVLAKPIKEQHSVIDIGCGFGDLLTYLRQTQNFRGTYYGLDFVREFVDKAQTLHQDDTHASFREFDINSDDLPTDHDFIVQSGMFNNLMDDNWQFLTKCIEKMFAAANVGVAFNALSTYVDYQDKGLYYADPLKVFDFCKQHITKKVTLQHDYLVKPNSIPFEYTVFLFK